MPIITLTTDFGLGGYYLPALKGALLKHNPDVTVIDISHDVKPYDIVQGAFILKNAYHHFPEGTIHLISVNNVPGPAPLIAFMQDNHYFIGPDNGVFSLMFGDQCSNEAYRLPMDNQDPFPTNESMALAVEHLVSDKPLHEIGLPTGETEKRIALQPVISTSQIRGSVIYLDHYGNVVVNVHRDLFEKVRNGRRFELFFKRHDPITRMSRQYYDVPVGDVLCLFNDAGYLTIAINMGRASGLLGLKLDDMVQIDFSS